MARIRTHPGEVLREEFIEPLGLSANAFATLFEPDCHCEEPKGRRSDLPGFSSTARDCFASLAMTRAMFIHNFKVGR